MTPAADTEAGSAAGIVRLTARRSDNALFPADPGAHFRIKEGTEMKALVYGETIWDVYPDGEVIGGAPFNFSAHLAHLGNEVRLITAVGNDSLGDRAFEQMKYHRIDTSFVQRNSYPTGRCDVTLDENGIPRYDIVKDVSYDHIAVDDALIQAIKDYAPDVFYFNSLIQRSAESRAGLLKILDRCRFRQVFCDINIREGCFDRFSLAVCMERSTILKVSSEESHWLYDIGLLKAREINFPRSAAKQYPSLDLIVYTLGKDGSQIYDTRTKMTYLSGKPESVPVVSTVGAGDCYGATFIDSYMRGDSLRDSMERATERSNLVVSRKEAVPF